MLTPSPHYPRSTRHNTPSTADAFPSPSRSITYHTCPTPSVPPYSEPQHTTFSNTVHVLKFDLSVTANFLHNVYLQNDPPGSQPSELPVNSLPEPPIL